MRRSSRPDLGRLQKARRYRRYGEGRSNGRYRTAMQRCDLSAVQLCRPRSAPVEKCLGREMLQPRSCPGREVASAEKLPRPRNAPAKKLPRPRSCSGRKVYPIGKMHRPGSDSLPEAAAASLLPEGKGRLYKTAPYYIPLYGVCTVFIRLSFLKIPGFAGSCGRKRIYAIP